MTRRPAFWPLAITLTALAGVALAVPPADKKDATPPAHGDAKAAKPSAAPATDAQQAAARIAVEGGLKATVWASEPLLSNPVAFCFDEKGVCYVAETNRFGKGVPDTRGYMQWLDDDLAARTIDDRLKMYAKFGYKGYEDHPDQVRRIVDTTGKGVADSASIFAGGFNQLKDGLAAGVLARKGSVYFTCIPSVYEFKAGGEKATATKELSTGYGNRAQFLGHDLHGLRMGPDGKLYFSIGDRGVNATDAGGKVVQVFDSGCVLRCDLDGKNLEVVHMGLRNPQELAFDDLGNLFTYDNNSDSGDQARWVQIVEGGDSGWRCGYQYGTFMHHAGVPQGNRGAWNAEQIWHVPSETSHPPAYVVPALANFGNGPAGMTAYPGLGLSERYNGHFFCADFTSSPSNSKIWSLGVKPKGATFEVTDLHPFVQTMVPTDCEFGPDGAFYILDWANGGWQMPDKGRIFKVRDEKAMADPRVAEAAKIIASDLTATDTAELVRQLGHAHRQVRQEAQFELVRRKDAATLTAVLTKPATELASLHAVWGLGQLGEFGSVVGQLGSPNPAARVAALKALGRAPKTAGLAAKVLPLLADPDAAVRAVAAVAYGSAKPADVQPLLDLLAKNDNSDAYLRQAAVEGLVRATPDAGKLVAAYAAKPQNAANPAVRLGVVLGLRKHRGEQLAQFVTDGDPTVQAEAARAICDENIVAALPALAGLSGSQSPSDPVLYRMLAANYKLGSAESAGRVARFAATTSAVPHLREFALKLLVDWSKPSRRDPITGCSVTLAPRDESVVRAAVTPVVASLFNGPESLRKEAAQATAKLGIAEVGPLMLAAVKDQSLSKEVRYEALLTLEILKARELAEATAAALNSPVDLLRAGARVARIKADPKAGIEGVPALLADPQGALVEKQLLLGAMGTFPESKLADETLAKLLDQELAGTLPPELKLDVTDAVSARGSKAKLKLHAPIREKLLAIESRDRAALAKDDLARTRDAIAGGDAERGKAVFLQNSAVYCQRCHMLDGQGGQVGPAMNGIGAKHPRDYLLQSIVNPSAKIAEGYQSVIVGTVDGKSLSGVLKSRTPKELTLVTAENKVVVIPADDIEAEKPDKSAMPEGLHQKLTRRELRDLIEFLASLKK